MTAKEHTISYVVSGTAASSFHVSDTIDWSSLSARIKNRVVVTEVPVRVPDRVERTVTNNLRGRTTMYDSS